ncbi:MAG: hypothetical protein MAGBODY4_01586 [Candidatus Marinimicrobia bacterium]|nr:hypothetical protein [Candidatus Neomarinimicrobiota bacterium]
MRADDMRLKVRQVDFVNLVVIIFRIFFDIVIGTEVFFVFLRQGRNFRALRRIEVFDHPLIEGEDRGCGADFRTHIGNGAFPRATYRAGARTEVFDNFSGAALDGQQISHFENDIFGSGPAVEFTFEVNSDEFRHSQQPRLAHHHIHSIGTADTNSDHPKSAGIGGVAVRSDHHTAGKGIVFEHHLVDNTGSRFPESDPVFLGR